MQHANQSLEQATDGGLMEIVPLNLVSIFLNHGMDYIVAQT